MRFSIPTIGVVLAVVSCDAFVPTTPFGVCNQNTVLVAPQLVAQVTLAAEAPAEGENPVAIASEEEAPVFEETPVYEPPVEKERFTLYISNIPFTTSDESLREIFERVGTVEQVAIPRNRDTMSTRGFAFVDMSTKEEMEKAVEELNEVELDGRPLYVNVSLPKGEANKRAGRRRKVIDEAQKFYVGNLPFGVPKETLYQHFAQFGDIDNVYIARDENNEDRGFGFITMASGVDVDAIIDEVNGSMYEGRRLTVRRPLPAGVKSSGGAAEYEGFRRIYFGNIDFDTTDETMRAAFEEFGEVKSVFINRDVETGRSRGFGFAQMKEEDALRAIEELNGIELDGRTIKVTFAEKKTPRVRIYVGNFGYDTISEDIRELFEGYGSVSELFFPMDNFSGQTRGFAIVSMDVQEGQRAIESLDGYDFNGRLLKVNEARPKNASGGGPGRRVKMYVGNLSFDTPMDVIRETFEEYGEVVDCFLPEDFEFGGSRGFGFVTMFEEDAKAAMAELDGIELDGRSIRVVEADNGNNRRGGGRGPSRPTDDDMFDNDMDMDMDDGY